MNKRFLLPLFAVFALASSVLHAQETVSIEGNQVVSLCENPCGTWFAGFPNIGGGGFLYTWSFYAGNGGPATGNPVYTVTNPASNQGTNMVTWCPEEPGNYTILLSLMRPDGGTNAIATGTYSFSVEAEFDLVAVNFVSGSHTNSGCDAPPSPVEELFPAACRQVCVGTVSTLNVNELLAAFNTGQIYQLPPIGTWTVQNGQTVPFAPPPAPQLLNIGTVYGTPGQEVCVPVTVNGFFNILGFQFAIGYDPTQVTYTGVQNVTPFLPAFSAAGNVGSPAFGTLSVTWNDPSAAGNINIPNDSILFEICFQVTGNQSSAIFISNTPFLPEVIDNDEDYPPFTFNNGAILIDTAATVSILWTQPGPAQVTFQYTGPEFWEGCTEFDPFINICFEVIAPPPAAFTTQPAASANGQVEVCEGQLIYFAAQSTDAHFYQWNFGDGTGSSQRNPQHAFTAAGTYEVQLITGAELCNCTDTSRVTVVVEGNEAPFVDCVATICEGTSVTYSATVGCSSYDWGISDNGTILDGGGSDDDFITIQWGAGPYGDITLATDGCPSLSTCTAAAFLRVPIVSADAPITGADRVCRGSREVYSLPPFEGTSVEWTVSAYGSIVSGQGTPSVTVQWSNLPIPPDDQWVRARYENCFLGCGGEAELPVRVRPAFFLRGEIAVCENATASYEAISNATNGGFPALFLVTDASGDTVWTSAAPATAASIDWTFGAGDFTVIATPQNPDDFCNDAVTHTVRVLAGTSVAPTITGQATICPGTAYTYTVDNPATGQRYRWQVTDGGIVTMREGAAIVVEWGTAAPYGLVVEQLSPPLFCTSVADTLVVSPVGSFAVSGVSQVCLEQIATYNQTLTVTGVPFAWSVQPASAGTIIGDAGADAIEVLWHSVGNAMVVLDVCGQQETINVTVSAPPAPIVPVSSACPGETTIVSTTGVFAAYRWQDTIGQVLATTPTVPLGNGYYRLEAVDNIGCVGATNFQVSAFPSTSVMITTPDFNLFCNTAILTRLYAEATEEGFAYQWYRDGMPIMGATASNYTALVAGLYRVGIVDENGCTSLSNTIRVDIDCNPGGGGGGAPGGGNGVLCGAFTTSFVASSNGDCSQRAYTADVSGGTPLDITWLFDDPDSGAANTASGSNVSHTYSRPGFYRVVMIARYDDGAGGAIDCAVMIPDTVFAIADFDHQGVCVGSGIQFTDLTKFVDVTSIVAWDWNFGDPASGAANVSTDKDPIHIFATAGDYTVTLTVTTAAGCTHALSKTVAVRPLPMVSFDLPMVNCAATVLPFQANVGSIVADVVWDFGDSGSGDANTSALRNSFHEYATPGDYVVTLEGTDVLGCVNQLARTLSIIPNTLAGAVDPAGTSSICAGDTLFLTAPTTTAVDWQWSDGTNTPSIAVHRADIYTVTLTDAQGCTYTPAAVQVDVVAAPRSPIRAVAFNDFNQPTDYTYDTLFICHGEDVFLETEQRADYTFLWSTGDTDNTAEFTEARNSQLAVGQHLVTLTVRQTSTLCAAVEQFFIVVRPTPNVPLINDLGVACSGTSHTLNVTNPQPAIDYFWSNGQGGTMLTTNRAGQYYARAISEDGCTAESDIQTIRSGPDITLVPNGCHTRCAPDTLCIPTIPNIVAYQWSLDGQPIPAPDGSVPNLIVGQSGSYTLLMTDTDGCMQTSEPLDIELLPGYGTLAGQIYYDLNDNQIIDAADSLAAAIGIALSNAGGGIQTVVTTTMGDYGFVNVPEDNYTLSLDTLGLPVGWSPLVAAVDTTFVGCAQEVRIDWLLVPACATAIDTTFSVGLCTGEVFSFQGQDYPIGTTASVTVNGGLGCDTIFTFTVTELPTTTETLNVGVCAGESYTYQGVDYPIGTNTAIALVNSVGCDSIIQLQVAALPTSTETLNVGVCAGESYTYQGVDYPIGTNVAITLVNSVGCDSIIQLQVAASPTSTETLNVSVCAGESYTYQGVDYPIGTNVAITLVNSAGCDSIVQLQVGASPSIDVVLSPTTSCPNIATGSLSIATLGGQSPFVYTLGGNTQSEPLFEDVAAGNYVLTVTDAVGCAQTFTTTIPALPTLVVALADMTLPCDADVVRLVPEILSGDDGALQFTWPDGTTEASFSAADPGTYTVAVANACQAVTETVRVMREAVGRRSLFYVPNAFSPNGDATNDAFQVYPHPDVEITAYSLQIFDRWGALQFSTDTWDDTWRGNDQGQAVYVWVLRATVRYCGGEAVDILDHGDVVLVR